MRVVCARRRQMVGRAREWVGARGWQLAEEAGEEGTQRKGVDGEGEGAAGAETQQAVLQEEEVWDHEGVSKGEGTV